MGNNASCGEGTGNVNVTRYVTAIHPPTGDSVPCGKGTTKHSDGMCVPEITSCGLYTHNVSGVCEARVPQILKTKVSDACKPFEGDSSSQCAQTVYGCLYDETIETESALTSCIKAGLKNEMEKCTHP